jgi:hypothetical protein
LALPQTYSIVKVRLIFQLYHPTKGTKVPYQNEPIFSSKNQWIEKGGKFSGSKFVACLSQAC